MNLVTLVFGLTLIGAGFVTLVRRLHDRSVQESILVMNNPIGRESSAVAVFAGLLVPIVTSIASGVLFVAVGLLSR